jgi:hypothetical protein
LWRAREFVIFLRDNLRVGHACDVLESVAQKDIGDVGICCSVAWLPTQVVLQEDIEELWE